MCNTVCTNVTLHAWLCTNKLSWWFDAPHNSSNRKYSPVVVMFFFNFFYNTQLLMLFTTCSNFKRYMTHSSSCFLMTPLIKEAIHLIRHRWKLLWSGLSCQDWLKLQGRWLRVLWAAVRVCMWIIYELNGGLIGLGTMKGWSCHWPEVGGCVCCMGLENRTEGQGETDVLSSAPQYTTLDTDPSLMCGDKTLQI